jgi:coenzyme F420-reducing hydrogenase delta subunit
LRLEWISASEGAKFRSTVNEFIDQITELGPLHGNSNGGEAKGSEAVEVEGN